MTTKARLHELIEGLPDSELPAAERLLEDLGAGADPVLRALLTAPEEPAAEDEVQAILAEKARIAAGGSLVAQDEAERLLFGEDDGDE